MAHIYIKDLKPAMMIDEVYMITQPVLRNTTRGDHYIAMFLSDKTGKANGRMWQVTESLYEQLPSEGFVRVQGKTELYQNAMQITANNVYVVEPDEVDLADYMPRTEKNIGDMFEELKEIVGTIKDASLSALVAEFLADSELMKKFCMAPAAMAMHHNYLGGLLEHTHNMLKSAVAVLPLYPKLQSDLVLAGIFLHDIAKTSELSYNIAFSYTDAGQMLGHIVQGPMMIKDKATAVAANGTTVDEEVLNALIHIIVSHHGQYDFGSPKLPATAEAFMVSRLDDLDAKMAQVTSLIEDEPGQADWTAWKNSLGTRLFRKRLTD